jgi:hypothetical protein
MLFFFLASFLPCVVQTFFHVTSPEFRPEFLVRVRCQGRAYVPHQSLVETYVVQAAEDGCEHLSAARKMVQVTARKV